MGPRRRLVALAVATATVAGAWWRITAPEDGAPVTPSSPVASPRSGGAPAGRTASASVPVAVASAGRTAIAPTSRAPSDAASSVEVCGFGRVATPGDATVEGDPRWRAAARATEQRLFAALRDRGDAPSLALALLLQARSEASDDVREASRHAATICGGDPACVQRQVEERVARSSAGDRETDALARLAAASRDPFVRAIGLEACASSRRGSGGTAVAACAMLNESQWAALEPGNAIAWLRAATAASAAGDAQGVDAALLRASRAAGARLYGDAVYGLVADAVPADAGEAERTAAHRVGLQAVERWTLPAYLTATRWCTRDAVRDTARREACGDLATALAERGATLMDIGMGIAIARRIDPTPTRADAWEMRRDALLAALPGPADPADLTSCAAVAASRSLWTRAARKGEVGALQEMLAASGLTAASAAERTRVRRTEALHAAMAAASAPAAASTSASTPR